MIIQRGCQLKEMKRITALSGFLYLATPYAKYLMGREAAARHAAILAGELMAHDLPVYSPIAQNHEVGRRYALPDTHEFWMRMDLPILACARGLVVAHMPGWSESRGVLEEIDYAERKYIPIFHLSLPASMFTN